MIPNLVSLPGTPWSVLPAGVHQATLSEIADRFVYNQWRRDLFDGLVLASRNLVQAGCKRLFLDGSFVTDKPVPRDYDACWHPDGIDINLIDPVFKIFDDNRVSQKKKFGGEFFPSTLPNEAGRNFVDFFQIDKHTGLQKGILLIDLANDSILQP
ncbi:MAG: DUF6932 family protein [Gammaproteobacteria bacterium]